MKNHLFNKTLLIFIILSKAYSVNAQVSATTANAVLVCDGGELKFDNNGIPSTHNIKLYYNTSKVDILTSDPSTAAGAEDVTASITLGSLNSLATTATKTGYYYLKGVPKANNAALCETPYQEIIVYKFKSLSVDFTAQNFCTTSPKQQSGKATTTDATTLAYQWYLVNNGTEQAISGATDQNYTPSANLAPGTYTYRLKVAYKVSVSGSDKYYCIASADQSVTINPIPTAPKVTVKGADLVTL